jgi:hypothetical protein
LRRTRLKMHRARMGENVETRSRFSETSVYLFVYFIATALLVVCFEVFA